MPMTKGDRLLFERQVRDAQKQAINEELDQRIRDHTREVERAQRVQRFQKGAKRPLDFLAIGDSWYDYPLDDNLLFYPWDFGIIWQIQSEGFRKSASNYPISGALWMGVHSSTELGKPGKNDYEYSRGPMDQR